MKQKNLDNMNAGDYVSVWIVKPVLTGSGLLWNQAATCPPKVRGQRDQKSRERGFPSRIPAKGLLDTRRHNRAVCVSLLLF